MAGALRERRKGTKERGRGGMNDEEPLNILMHAVPVFV